jgi:hypothetical protein
LLRRYGVIGRYQGEAAQRSGPMGDILSTSFKDELLGFPGGIGGRTASVSPKRIAQKAMGQGGATWNPLTGRIRGTQGSPLRPWGAVSSESTFAPVAAGEDLGYYVEGLNRAAPWLHQIAKGVDPLVAKLKVGAAQVDYAARNFTPTERQWMTRFFPWYKFCVPASHEILTQDGWKTFDQLTVGESVLSMDHTTGVLEWVPLEAVNVFDFDGELIKYEQSRKHRKIRFLFTEDHRWPVVTPVRERASTAVANCGKRVINRTGGKRSFVLGQDLCPQHMLPCAGEFLGKESILSPRHAAILGWVVTDGYSRWVGNSCEMLVYQSPKKFLGEVVKLLGNEPRKANHDDGTAAVPVDRADINEIVKVFRNKQDLVRIVTRLSREAAEAMWDAMFKAEGCLQRTTGLQHFCQDPQFNPEVLEAFQILTQLTGRSANLAVQGCTVKKAKHYHVNYNLSREWYCGKVWCPTTKHGTWVMRHEGAVVITGNSSRQVPYVIRELWERPGGLTAQTLRAANVGRSKETLLPEYISETTAIPVGTDTPLLGSGDPDVRRYLTGFGLMHEDPMRFVSASPKALGLEALSRMNPLLKGPIEYFTGQSFFERDQTGGRRLEDMDPLIGRLIANLTGREEAYKLPQILEVAAANSPLSRVLTTARQISDPRKRWSKDVPLPGPAALSNILTGARISDVSPRTRDYLLRSNLQQIMKGADARTFEKVYFPKDQLAKMEPEERVKALRMQALMAMLAERAKKRVEAKKRKE